jgi:hypothetical protein
MMLVFQGLAPRSAGSTMSGLGVTINVAALTVRVRSVNIYLS